MRSGGAIISKQGCQDIFAKKSGHFRDLPDVDWRFRIKYNACKSAYPNLHKAFIANRHGQFKQGLEAAYSNSNSNSNINSLDKKVLLEAHQYLDEKGWNEKHVSQIDDWKAKRKQEILKGKKAEKVRTSTKKK